MKLLGIDFGTKRIGLALGDTATKLALPFKTVLNDNEIFENLKKIVATDMIETFVVGRPVSLGGGDSGKTLDEVKDFSAKIKEKIGIPIIFEDERFSSDLADSLSHLYGEKIERDSVAAMAILQSYLDKISDESLLKSEV